MWKHLCQRGPVSRTTRRQRKAQLRVETLEERTTPVASLVGPQFTVAAVTGLEAGPPAVAVVDPAGDFVATWESLETDGSGIGVYAQRFQANGTPVGSPLLVNTTTHGNQSRPAIATDGNQHFVLAWQSETAANGYDVYYKTGDFGATDWLPGLENQVNVVTTGNQTSPAVAMDHNGTFAITWQSDQNPSTGLDIYGRYGQYSVGLLGVSDTELIATAGDQQNPTVAMAATNNPASGDGQVIVAWTGPGPVSSEGEATSVVMGTLFRYTADLSSITADPAHTDVQLTAAPQNDQVNPAVAMAPGGQFVLVWQSEGETGSGSDVFSRQFDANGNGIGTTNVLVNSVTQEPQRSPSVGIDADGNYFVVWQSQGADSRSWGIVGRAFNADGTQARADFVVNVNEQGPQTTPVLAVTPDKEGQTVVVWAGPYVPSHGGTEGEEGVEGTGGHEPGLFARRFRATGTGDLTPAGTALHVNGLEFQLAVVGAGEDVPSAATACSDGTYVVLRQGFEESGDASGYGIYGQRLAADGTPLGAAFLVNQTTLGYQSHPAVAALPGGGFVAVWQSEVRGATATDPSQYDIYARIYTYDGAGNLVAGDEFLVNSTLNALNQTHPQVASDAAGGFVIVWQSDAQLPDEYGTEIYARRYSTSGATVTALDSEFRVNTVTAATTTPTVTGQAQVTPVIAMNAAGQFAIAWVSDHNVANDATDTEKSIFVRWFSAGGVPAGPEFLANVYTKDAQEHPAIAINEVGNVVVAWQSINQETGGTGVSWGVFARQFRPDGSSPQTQEFQVNDTVAGPQRFASVGVKPNGYFTIAWQAINQDGSSWGVFQRQFKPDGTPETGEQLVNQVTNGPQILPVFARKANGDYLVVWNGTAAEHVDGIAGRLSTWGATDRDSDFVRELYLDLLHREPEAAGLAGWVSALTTLGRDGVAQGIWGSLEHRGIQVTELYQSILDRVPEAGGLTYWVGALMSGVTEEQVRASILSSAEHQGMYPTPEAFIGELYEDVLHRTGSPEEVALWGSVASSLSNFDMAMAFINSSEGHQLMVDSGYHLFLDRAPEDAGLQAWTEQMDLGVLSELNAAVGILASQEHYDIS